MSLISEKKEQIYRYSSKKDDYAAEATAALAVAISRGFVRLKRSLKISAKSILLQQAIKKSMQ